MGEEAVMEAVHAETAEPVRVAVGDKEIVIRPLKRRWQAMFRKAVLLWARPGVAAMEEIQNAATKDMLDFKSITEILFNSELETDSLLDDAAAVVLASQVVGAEKRPEETVKEQREWLQDNSTTEQMRKLVETQSEKEKFITEMGESLPAKLAQFARLAGGKGISENFIKQASTNSSPKSPETPTGDGASAG